MELNLFHIKKSFEGFQLLSDVSISHPPKTIISLFGENGSGKSTLINIISGFLKADSGKVVYNGINITGQSPIEIARNGIGRIWQNPRIFKNLSVMDNLIIPAKDNPGEKLFNYLIRPRSILYAERYLKDQAITIAEQLNLGEKLSKISGSLSLGQQKLLSVGMQLMRKASLLLMDEPFAGISPLMIDHISEVLLGLRQQGKSMLLVEHNREMAKLISDKIYTILKGSISE
jgi:ABC-type branched-subunit amino acid transport system ATPase component